MDSSVLHFHWYVDPQQDEDSLLDKVYLNENSIPFVYNNETNGQMFRHVYGKVSSWIHFYDQRLDHVFNTLIHDTLDIKPTVSPSFCNFFFFLFVQAHIVLRCKERGSQEISYIHVNVEYACNMKKKKKKKEDTTDSKKTEEKETEAAKESNVDKEREPVEMSQLLEEAETMLEFIDCNEISRKRELMEKMLLHQMEWSAHLGIQTLILPAIPIIPLQGKGTKGVKCPVGYASALLRCFGMNPNGGSSGMNSSNSKTSAGSNRQQHVYYAVLPVECSEMGYKSWKSLSQMIFTSDIGLCSSIEPGIVVGNKETKTEIESMVNTWFSEGVRHVFLDVTTFIKNKKGFPVLSQPHQHLLQRLMRTDDVTVIITGNLDNGLYYSQYIMDLRKRATPLTEEEAIEKPFWDLLQTPLQPLIDNLDNGTYETFESDPVKYVKYEEAITLCLQDLEQSPSFRDDPYLIVLVVGGGRGPLVDCTLRSSDFMKTDKPLKIFVIEKNPHAVVILKYKEKHYWNNTSRSNILSVQVFDIDIRDCQSLFDQNGGPKKAHLIISELLGSFGDNELSPECLDAAQLHLVHVNAATTTTTTANDINTNTNINTIQEKQQEEKEEEEEKASVPLSASATIMSGVSIPSSYSSYICGVSCGRLWRKLKEFPKDFETPWVVRFMNKDMLTSVARLWTFEHPNHYLHGVYQTLSSQSGGQGLQKKQHFPLGNNFHNARYKEVSWTIDKECNLYGFMGFFDSSLYKDVQLMSLFLLFFFFLEGIVPETHSEGMFSWYPMFFPLNKPLSLKKGDTLTVHFWRKSNEKGMWYEWCVTSPEISIMHNPNHRSYLETKFAQPTINHICFELLHFFFFCNAFFIKVFFVDDLLFILFLEVIIKLILHSKLLLVDNVKFCLHFCAQNIDLKLTFSSFFCKRIKFCNQISLFIAI
ncbi:hypothetical protein RFI_04767 [Reticulomyxa filosa]|uniref:Protein arginine N-methyltransferase n=1 Tax=Reticulomyxa filosa TaxID=46433 RepID=X6P2B5_RETFI|nr:hypothetical protein RFI_04767 [Reticulomyxa filosa]|eukprot:ETO32351.1 hypothetical protein RFI_04767 [Reticulomyxa filosa]